MDVEVTHETSETELQGLTVVQLQAALKQRGLKVSGTKAQLVGRLKIRLEREKREAEKKRPRGKDKDEEERPTKKSTAKVKPEKLQKQTKFPTKFQVESGEVFWGQLQCLVEGHANHARDSKAGPLATGRGGTIIQSSFAYRAAAKPGTWLVMPVYSGSGKKRYITAYLLCHESENANDWVKRCAAVGISHGARHADKAIVYVNRYDWSWHHGSAENVKKELTKLFGKDFEDDEDEDDEGVERLIGGRLCMVDSEHYEGFLKALVSKKPTDGVFTTSKGCCITDESIEYELAWMCYSGNKHSLFPQCDELVAFVYDHTYSALETETDGELTLDLGG